MRDSNFLGLKSNFEIALSATFLVFLGYEGALESAFIPFTTRPISGNYQKKHPVETSCSSPVADVGVIIKH